MVFLVLSIFLIVAACASAAKPGRLSKMAFSKLGQTGSASSDPSVQTDLATLYKAIESYDFRDDWVLDLTDSRLKPYMDKAAGEKKLDELDPLDALLAKRISLPQLWAVAFANNPDLESMRKMALARAEMYPQTMYVDSLAAQYRSFVQGIDTRTSGGGMNVGTELLFPGPGVISFNGRLAHLEVDMALQDYSMKLRDVCAELFDNANERESFRKMVTILDETVQALSAFEISLKSRFTTDRAMYPEFSRLQAERDRTINERNTMKRMLDAMLPKINHFLGRRFDAPLGEIEIPPVNPSLSGKAIADVAVKSRQEIRIQEIMLELLKTLASLKRRETLSPISPGFAYTKNVMAETAGLEGSMGMGKAGTSGTSGKSRPDPNSPYRLAFSAMPATARSAEYGGPVAYLRELDRRIEAENEKLSEMRNALRAEVAAAVADYENSRQSAITEISKVVPNLKRGMESAASGYRTGNVSFLEWIELFMKTLEARMAAIKFDLAAKKGIAKLMMLQGSSKVHPDF